MCYELSKESNLSDIVWLLIGFSYPNVDEPKKCCNYPYIIENAYENFVIKYPLVEFHHIEHDEWDQNKEVENQ
jgi:hypothetical protein